MSRERTITPEEYLRHADPVLREVIADVARESDGQVPTLPTDAAMPPDPSMRTDHYGVLLRAIVSQNLSEIASRSIWMRLIDRFGGRPPTPQEILAADAEELRHAVGLSRAKAISFRSLADRIITDQLQLDRLRALSDEDVIAQLSAVKGIGTWTAHIFLMFHLHRPDVLPVGDLSLRHAFERAYGLDGPPSPAEMERIAEPWRPYRSLASFYLWRLADSTPQL